MWSWKWVWFSLCGIAVWPLWSISKTFSVKSTISRNVTVQVWKQESSNGQIYFPTVFKRQKFLAHLPALKSSFVPTPWDSNCSVSHLKCLSCSYKQFLFTYVKLLVIVEISEGIIIAFCGFGPWSGFGEQDETNLLQKWAEPNRQSPRFSKQKKCLHIYGKKKAICCSSSFFPLYF